MILERPPAAGPMRDNLMEFVRALVCVPHTPLLAPTPALPLSPLLPAEDLFAHILPSTLEAALLDLTSDSPLLSLVLLFVRVACGALDGVPVLLQWRVLTRLSQMCNARERLAHDDVELLLHNWDCLKVIPPPLMGVFLFLYIHLIAFS